MFRFFTLCALLGLTAAGLGSVTPRPPTMPKPYSVVDGKVDKAPSTATAATPIPACAAMGRMGPAAPMPNLTNSLKTMTYEQFTETVINGRQNVTGAKRT